MKKMALTLMIINFFLLLGCTPQHNVINSDLVPTKSPELSIVKSENSIINIPLNSVNGITSDEAIKLCQNAIGEKDDETFMFQFAEDHTDRNIGYHCDGAVEYEGNQYYIIRILWSDDKESYWSTIGFLGVLSSGKEIYEAIHHSNNTYSLGELISIR